MRRIYFDHNATTPVHPDVLEAMLPFYKEKFGNPSSIHGFGQEARSAVEAARGNVAAILGCDKGEIIFTSGGTEADNLALVGAARALRKKGEHIAISSIEHHAILNTATALQKEGFRIAAIPVDKSGIVDPEDVKKALEKDTIFVSIIHGNNEVGTIQPIEQIGKILNERQVLFHTDAVQTVGKMRTNVRELGVQLLSLSGHKINGPKGIGALFMKNGVRIEATMRGGHHEKGRRAGTENVPGIVGLGKACEIAMGEGEAEQKTVRELRDRLEKGILERIDGVTLNGHPAKRLAGTTNLSFGTVEGESMILSLDMEGIGVSSGSACTSGSLEPSHVLVAMGVPPERAQSSLRFSLGRGNTKEEVDFLLEVFPKIVERLKAMSPLANRAKVK
ncbi:MAG: cysteine desulfurase NifS [Candidatus Eisenbacteria bacterium]|nr:cysteine desulfurase NifS [Candidatus Eisenbacteria bacterium]